MKKTSAPETNELIRTQLARVGITPTALAAKLSLKCEDLERERNALRETLEHITNSDVITDKYAFATIRRYKYPNEYKGWNVEHDSPEWTSDRLDAAPVPIGMIVSELHKVAARETNIWAVVFP